MLNRLAVAVLALTFSCGLVLAETAPAAKAEPMKKEAKVGMMKFVGVVESYDAATMKLSVKDKASVVKEFMLTKEVKLPQAGLKSGDMVTIMLKGPADKPEVAKIKLHQMKMKKAPAEKK